MSWTKIASSTPTGGHLPDLRTHKNRGLCVRPQLLSVSQAILRSVFPPLLVTEVCACACLACLAGLARRLLRGAAAALPAALAARPGPVPRGSCGGASRPWSVLAGALSSGTVARQQRLTAQAYLAVRLHLHHLHLHLVANAQHVLHAVGPLVLQVRYGPVRR